MDDAMRDRLTQAGVNVDTAMDRFMGNEKMLLYFLGKFGDDENYGKFKAAMENGSYEDAFRAIHGFKGLCGNLSLDRLYELSSREVEFLRGDVQKEEAEKLLPELTEEYGKLKEALSGL